MMKLSMLSLVPVVAAYRKKCDIVGSGRAQCKDPTDSAYSFEQSDAITACNATAACELVCTCFVTADGQSWEYVPTPREECQTDITGVGQAECTDSPDGSYTSDQLEALNACDQLNYCTPQCSCFVAPADENGVDGEIWLLTPRTQKCDLGGASMAECHPYDSGDTKDFYVSSQIHALKFNESNPCGDPTCTCFVTDETDEQEAGQSWVFTPRWQAGHCCRRLTDVASDPSAVYHVYMDLKGIVRSRDHHGSDECGDDVHESESPLTVEISKDDLDQEALMSGRLGTNNRVGTTSNDGGASDLDVCSKAAEAQSWCGYDAVNICATYNAYKEENDGLAECYEPVKGHVVSGGKVTTVDRMQWWQNPV